MTADQVRPAGIVVWLSMNKPKHVEHHNLPLDTFVTVPQQLWAALPVCTAQFTVPLLGVLWSAVSAAA